jgi:hypothetical protein
LPIAKIRLGYFRWGIVKKYNQRSRETHLAPFFCAHKKSKYPIIPNFLLPLRLNPPFPQERKQKQYEPHRDPLGNVRTTFSDTKQAKATDHTQVRQLYI